MNPATNAVVGPLVDILGGPDLLDAALVHHRDPVGHRQRLLLVVGHVDERDPDLALDPLQLDLQALAQLEVERAERLVEQQDLGVVDERARERDALLLAPRELVRPAVGLAPRGRRARALRATRRSISSRATFLRLQPEGDVVADAEVREERVALEDGVGRPLVRGQRDDVLAVDQDRGPSLGSSKPATIRSVVVLPQPLGPSRVKNSPCRELRG